MTEPRTVITEEPEDGAVVAELDKAGDIRVVYIRRDADVDADERDPDEHWFIAGGDPDGIYPVSWRVLNEGSPTLVRLHRNPDGVSVRLVWGVYSPACRQVYSVKDDAHDTAVREAALLARGVDGDPEQTPEPGAAPASRYVMTTPRGTVTSGWSWPAGWTPPPAESLGG